MKKILIINAGSSSLKYQLIDMDDEKVLAKGNAERIGIPDSKLNHSPLGKDSVVVDTQFDNHIDAIKMVISALVHPEYGVIKDMSEISAVGHRVVHGGEKFSKSVIIDEEVMDAIKKNVELAPLHNPANIMGIEACKNIMPNVPMTAVFDTAFHQTMPNKAFLYAVPYEAYEEYGIRRYGFHGTSHKYVAMRAAILLNKPLDSLKIITCHLGNGASITAVKHGKSIDTSMGFTPLEGVPMGTRSGSIDPAIINYMMEKAGLSSDEVNEILNKRSGVLGLSGISSDFRDLVSAAKEGNKRAKIALDVYDYQVEKFIGSYAAAMGGVDCIVFTAGIGENTSVIREDICTSLEYMGIDFDKERNNNIPGKVKEGPVTTDKSKISVLVIPTDEELMIARETMELI